VLRLGISNKGLTEIMAVAEHVASLAAFADGFLLEPDVPSALSGPGTALVAPLEEHAASEALTEIRSWAADTLGVAHVPAFWRVLARHPRFLASTWAKDRLVFGAGEIDAIARLCTAIAVAMNLHSRYWTAYFNPWVRRVAGLDDAGMVELGAAVMHFVSFNTIAHGMMLEPPFTDIASEDFRPGGRFAESPGPLSAAREQ
jgi:hypothetical protein